MSRMPESDASTRRDRSTTVLSVRFTPDELEKLKDEASKAGVPLSALVRNSVLAGPTVAASITGNGNNGSTGPSVVVTFDMAGYESTTTPSSPERAREFTFAYDH